MALGINTTTLWRKRKLYNLANYGLVRFPPTACLWHTTCPWVGTRLARCLASFQDLG